jgi:hypothetical protein
MQGVHALVFTTHMLSALQRVTENQCRKKMVTDNKKTALKRSSERTEQ